MPPGRPNRVASLPAGEPNESEPLPSSDVEEAGAVASPPQPMSGAMAALEVGEGEGKGGGSDADAKAGPAAHPHEHTALPDQSDDKGPKPVSYVALFRWVGWCDGSLGCTTCLPCVRRRSCRVWPARAAACAPPAAPLVCRCLTDTPRPTCRFADRVDWMCMAMGSVGAGAAGAAMPMFSILFGGL
jgi:hypothetical protein